MKIDNISSLLYALIRNRKDEIAKNFEVCIANEKENGVKLRLKHVYDEYRRREGESVIHKLDAAVMPLVSAPYKDCSFTDLCLSDTVINGTSLLLKEWKHRDYLIAQGLSPANKVLLEGPPGNGKTSYAIALSKELGLPLLNTSSSLMLDSYLGKSEKNVSLLFRHMPEECVLFFDEFEAMASSRGRISEDGGGAGRAWNSIVTSFLVNMECIRPSCIFIAATNRTDMLDKAIIRRFDLRMAFNNPTDEQKIMYTEKYLNTYGLKWSDFYSQKEMLNDAVSYSDMERILRLRHKEIVLQNLTER